MRQRLILCPPPTLAPDTLTEALRAGDVAAVVLPRRARDLAALVRAAQVEGAAALVVAEAPGEGWPAPHAADGLHLAGPTDMRRDLLDKRPEGATVGAAAASRHEAMILGELGADYLWFGGTDALDEEAVELAAWWQRLFETPCVIAGPDTDAALSAMIASGAEFVALDVFSGGADPLDRVAAVDGRLTAEAPAS